MELKIAVSTIGIAIVLTVAAGLFQGLTFGGLISMDPSVWPMCGCIQGLVTGIVLVVVNILFAVVQGIVLSALLWRVPWARAAGFILALIYLCSGLFPFAIVLFFALLRLPHSSSERE